MALLGSKANMYSLSLSPPPPLLARLVSLAFVPFLTVFHLAHPSGSLKQDTLGRSMFRDAEYREYDVNTEY